jgi:hypothetical protein
MKISAKYTNKDWKELNFNKEEDWQRAINIFKDRIESRFMKPILKIESDIYSGFAVMALDCLLIETLQQFKKGKKETPQGKVERYFKDFLTKEFKGYFNEGMARMFYDEIRCGILHQAEIKGNSRIRMDTKELVKYLEDKKGLIINRKKFHSKIREVFNNYINKLQDPSNSELRKNFKKKMDYICRV